MKRSEIERIYKTIPQTESEIKAFTEEALVALEAQVESFLQESKRDFSTLQHWHTIIASLFEKGLILISTCHVDTKGIAIESAEKLNSAIEEVMSRPEIFEVMLAFAEDRCEDLTPSQRTYLLGLVKSLDRETLSDDLKLRVVKVEEILLTSERALYTYRTGEGAEKRVNPFRLINFNSCCAWGRIPLLWGGLLPWELRINDIVSRILKEKPHLICLQEVFDEKAAAAFYDKLKGHYAHFYYNIGPRQYGLSKNTLGLPSGHFIASQLPIEEFEFIPFGENAPLGMSYGFVSMKIEGERGALARVLATHLHPFSNEEGRAWRQKEIEQIIAYVNEKEESHLPTFLVGDLNTEWNNGEPSDLLIQKYFYNALNADTKKKTFDNRTCCDYREYWWGARRDLAKFTPTPEIIDYALLYKNGAECEIETRIISMSDPDAPEDALSDHQALLSKIRCGDI